MLFVWILLIDALVIAVGLWWVSWPFKRVRYRCHKCEAGIRMFDRFYLGLEAKVLCRGCGEKEKAAISNPQHWPVEMGWR